MKGIAGNALSFNIKSSYVLCGKDASLNITDAITIELWVKFDSFASNEEPIFNKSLYRIYHRGASTGNRLYFLYYTNSRKKHLGDSAWTGQAGVSTVTELKAGKWYHIAAVKSGDTMSIYVNGQKERELECLKGCTINTSEANRLSIGRLHGAIDEVRIYNRALSAAEIKDHYEMNNPLL